MKTFLVLVTLVSLYILPITAIVAVVTVALPVSLLTMYLSKPIV